MGGELASGCTSGPCGQKRDRDDKQKHLMLGHMRGKCTNRLILDFEEPGT